MKVQTLKEGRQVMLAFMQGLAYADHLGEVATDALKAAEMFGLVDDYDEDATVMDDEGTEIDHGEDPLGHLSVWLMQTHEEVHLSDL